MNQEFVLEYYRNIRERLTSQGDRMWTRFNYFLTIETAMMGAYFFQADSLTDGYKLIGIVLLGIVWSLVWYLIAVQDLWFYEDRYKKMKNFEKQVIKKQAGMPKYKDPSYKVPTWKIMFCFKIPKCGSTTFSAICPLLFLILWFIVGSIEMELVEKVKGLFG